MALEEPVSSLDSGINPHSYEGARDQRTRTEVFVSVVNGFVNSGTNRQLKIMVIGEAGQGKSTLINALVGSEVATEGDQLKAGTNEIQQYKVNQNGVNIAIWDTPGFGMGLPADDDKMVEKLKISGCEDVDLALFCIRLDQMRFPTRVHYETILKLNEVFGRKFWKHCLFIYTFANNVQEFCPEGVEMEYYFSERCDMFTEKIREALKGFVKLNKEELDAVRGVPVGSYKKGLFRDNPWALPDREDWFIMFWIECTEHMHKRALSALLKANYHRLEAGDALQSSLCSPPPNFDAHERLLQATEEEILDVRGQMDHKHTPQTTTNVTGARDFCIQMDDEDIPETTGAGLAESPVVRHRQTGRSASHPYSNSPRLPNVTRSLGTQLADAEKGVHDRDLPLHETLLRQLEKEDSSFLDYISLFAKERGKRFFLVGHVTGFIEGLKAYLSSSPEKSKTN